MLLGCVASLWAIVRVIRCLLLLGKGPALVIRLELYLLGAVPSARGLCVYGHGGEVAEAVKQRTAKVQTPDQGGWDEDEPSTT
jgi:hypothetical protein